MCHVHRVLPRLRQLQAQLILARAQILKLLQRGAGGAAHKDVKVVPALAARVAPAVPRQYAQYDKLGGVQGAPTAAVPIERRGGGVCGPADNTNRVGAAREGRAIKLEVEVVASRSQRAPYSGEHSGLAVVCCAGGGGGGAGALGW